jgi:hypothetical protein
MPLFVSESHAIHHSTDYSRSTFRNCLAHSVNQSASKLSSQKMEDNPPTSDGSGPYLFLECVIHWQPLLVSKADASISSWSLLWIASTKSA